MKTIYALLLLLCVVLPLSAQFNTLRYGDSTPFSTIKPTPETPEVKEESTPKEVATSPSSLRISMPLPSLLVTSPFGHRQDPFHGRVKMHRGIDLRCNADAVLAMFAGEVKKVAHQKNGLGHYVVIKHGDFEVTYGHLEIVFVRPGDIVQAGDKVAISGNTGRSTGPHLHLELKYKGKVTNPITLLSFVEKYNNISSHEKFDK